MDNIIRSQSDDKYRPADNLDEALQRELDEALGSMSLEDIVAEEEKQAKPSAPGVKVGKVIAIQGDDIFVDMGGKSQGILPATQFENEPLPAVGDRIEVVIEGYEAGEGLLNLSRQGAVMAAAWETIAEGQVVEGRVTGHNKGGLELDINGLRAFMPISQIEIFRIEVDSLPVYNNQRLKCEVTEVDRADKNVLVSRRNLLEREAAEAREKAYGALAEGQVLQGTVRTIMPYGAFVDLGGIDGLLHVRDMSYARVDDPRTVVQEGQKLEVKVLKIDRATRKISLGLKQVLPDPWSGVDAKYPAQSLVRGKVTKLMDFGAFVELEPGVEGLVPISEMTFERRIKHPSEVVKEGVDVEVRVLTVDLPRKRISLSIKQVGDDPWVGASARWPANSVVKGKVKRLTDFGAFIEVAPGVEGLVHISELSENRVRSVADAVQEGQEIDAKVLSVDEENKRMSLSIKQLLAMPDYMGSAAAEAEPAPEAKPQPKRKMPLKGGF